jgi:hypothetical protein
LEVEHFRKSKTCPQHSEVLYFDLQSWFGIPVLSMPSCPPPVSTEAIFIPVKIDSSSS